KRTLSGIEWNRPTSRLTREVTAAPQPEIARLRRGTANIPMLPARKRAVLRRRAKSTAAWRPESGSWLPPRELIRRVPLLDVLIEPHGARRHTGQRLPISEMVERLPEGQHSHVFVQQA